MAEILLMGGIPVIKRSTLTSCYDDSDNTDTNGWRRGSLPLVVVDQWGDVTLELLTREWDRITAVPKGQWDWRRIFLSQHVARIRAYHSR